MTFKFDPLRYVAPGFESAPGEMDGESRSQVVQLRQSFPEISEWGDQALYTAWVAFSDAVRMTGWSDDLERTEDFLNFLCWEQTRGAFPWGNSIEQLAKAGEWKQYSTDLDNWHKPGLWATFDKDGVPVQESFGTTGYASRAEAIRALNKRWSGLLELGYYVQELQATGPRLL